jgi:pimeloyl-ACP methyl ester carboxylesterase
MQKIYCISGLGADHRIFKDLSIEDYEFVPVKWVAYDRNDSLPSYAQKLTGQIKGKNPVILGLSMGGMLAVEIAKLLPDSSVFIVSSSKITSELQIHGGVVAKWLVNSMVIPPKLLTIPSSFVLDYLGARTSTEKQLLSQMMKDSDGGFMKWALKAIFSWQNQICPGNVFHIHGTADKIIPPSLVHPDVWIEGGTHIMVYNRADEVSKIIAGNLPH